MPKHQQSSQAADTDAGDEMSPEAIIDLANRMARRISRHTDFPHETITVNQAEAAEGR